ncbi:hypothetical protein D3C86_1097230 [compost metagenome]
MPTLLPQLSVMQLIFSFDSCLFPKEIWTAESTLAKAPVQKIKKEKLQEFSNIQKQDPTKQAIPLLLKIVEQPITGGYIQKEHVS